MEDKSLTALIQEYLGRKDAEKLFDAGYNSEEVEKIVMSDSFDPRYKVKIVEQFISLKPGKKIIPVNKNPELKEEKKSEKSNVLRLKEIPDERNRITRWDYLKISKFGVRDIRIGKEDYLDSMRLERDDDVITRWN